MIYFFFFFFFFNDTATTEIYTLSLHDALPISRDAGAEARQGTDRAKRAHAVTHSDAHGAIDAVWRIESARLIAGLTRITGDVGLAEDLAQDALVAALERWPESGVPDNPGALLMASAQHRARSEEHTSELQSQSNLVCRLLL